MMKLPTDLYCVILRLVFAGLALLPDSSLHAQQSRSFYDYDPQKTRWVDSVFNALTPAERLGQLFVVAAFSNRDQNHVERTLDLVCNYNVGGLCFFQGGPVRQAMLTNYYQANSKVPLLISIDGEWGLAMRLDSTIRFPRQMTLGAMRNENLIYDMGAEIARQMRRMGIHINFAPVIDINNNPANPVISVRSFGEDREAVTRKGLLYMRGLQENGLIANGKHFPGHGDTDVDSHLSLPVINKTRTSIDSLELYPFKKLMSQGLQSLMVAHLFIPAYDTTRNTATTLSLKVVTELLKKELGFKGLVFTDALNMKGVSSFFEPGAVEVKALLAGNDVLLYSEDVPGALARIQKALETKEIIQEEIDERVKKILAAKYWAGLNKYKPVELKNLYNDLNSPEANYLNQQLFESALTLLRNKNDIIPFKNLDTLKFASVTIGDSINIPFNRTLEYYAPFDFYSLNRNARPRAVDSLVNLIRPYNTVIISIHNTNVIAAKNYGITEAMTGLIEKLHGKCRIILDIFGNPYTLSKLKGAELADALLISYEGTELSQSLSAQLFFGGAGANGRLPVSVSGNFRTNDGLVTSRGLRLRYTFPEELSIPSAYLTEIDTVVKKAIAAKAMPGCQVLVAREGKVIYYKSFGYHSYEKARPVRNFDLFDLASVTKTASTTIALMSLYEKDKISLDKKISKYLIDLKLSNKKDIVLRDMLCHQAGLQSWIPFWKSTVVGGKPSSLLYRTARNDTFSVRVAEELYMRWDYVDTIREKIILSPLAQEKKYVYSDLGFILAKDIVEVQSGIPIDSLVKRDFYRPLGLSTMCFRPRKRFSLMRIVPTEYDEKFRRQMVHGDVHDPAAAMLGGVAGHAGLFSNANDLAILYQMLLNNGEYAGRQYFKENTVEEFTRQQFPSAKNRRGLGFDKPEPDRSKEGPTSREASLETFGHTGFTGTCVWADPEKKLIYVFLSNRVHPNAENDKLVKMNVRTNIQQVIYRALEKSEKGGSE